jgi:DNA-binding PadR family transcriptional regulator
VTDAQFDVLWALEPYIAATAWATVDRLGWPGDGRSVAPVLRSLERQGMVSRFEGAWRITDAGRAALERQP